MSWVRSVLGPKCPYVYQNVWRHLAENFQRLSPNFFQVLHRRYRALQNYEDRISIFHTFLEIFTKNCFSIDPLFSTCRCYPASRLKHNVVDGECYRWHKFDQNRNSQFWEKNVQTDPLSKRLAPPSGKFSAITPNFLHALHRRYRALQNCDERISKFHTILEIFTKNCFLNWPTVFDTMLT